jgi:putative aldouronate transport system substrate-binding protein
MKKLIAIMLAVLCVVGIFAGCNKNPNTNETKGPGQVQTDETGKPTLTIGIPVKTTVEDYETNAYSLWLEEKMGVNLEFQVYAASAADYKTQLATQMLDPSVKLPDILVQFTSLGDAVWETYGEDGYFIDLTDMWDDKEKSKIWWDAVSSFDPDFIDNVLTRCEADNGRRYAFPMIERGLVDSLPYIPMINKEWLKTVNMAAPTNTEELYNVLKAFKTEICDKKGEGYYPLVGNINSNMGADVLWWICNLFCDGYDYDRWFALSEDGKQVIAPFTTNEYREALKFIRKLLDEGLLAKNTFTTNTTTLRSIINSKDESRVGIFVGHTTIYWNDIGNECLYDYEALDLFGYCKRNEYGNNRCAFITEDCADPELAWSILMEMCSLESSYRQRYGILGEQWDWAESDAVSYMGLKCDIRLYEDLLAVVGNESWKTVGPTVLPNAESETVDLGELDDWTKYRYNINGQAYKWFERNEKLNKYVYPIIVLTTAEADTNPAARSNTQNAVTTFRNKFCQGTDGLNPNNDADWQAYLQELDKQGLQTWLEQYQDVYEERYMEKTLAAGNK